MVERSPFLALAAWKLSLSGVRTAGPRLVLGGISKGSRRNLGGTRLVLGTFALVSWRILAADVGVLFWSSGKLEAAKMMPGW